MTDLFAGREDAWTRMSAKLIRLMEEEGVEYGDRTHTYNSRLAQELAVWGDEEGVTDAMHDALFRAYFVDNRNVAATEVLVDVAASVGLDAAQARSIVEDRTYQEAVDDHWKRATRPGGQRGADVRLGGVRRRGRPAVRGARGSRQPCRCGAAVTHVAER